MSDPVFEIEGGEIFIGTGKKGGNGEQTIRFLGNKKTMGNEGLSHSTECVDLARVIAPTLLKEITHSELL